MDFRINLQQPEYQYFLAPLVIGLISAVIGAYFASRHTREAERSKLLFELHREINGPEMMVFRTTFQDVLRDNPGRNLRDLYEDDVIRPLLHPVWVVSGFYERVLYAMENDYIRRRRATKLFAPLYFYFFGAFFDPRTQNCGWEEYRERLVNLHQMFHWYASRKNLKRWKRDAAGYQRQHEEAAAKRKAGAADVRTGSEVSSDSSGLPTVDV